jgi:hypothetical protein
MPRKITTAAVMDKMLKQKIADEVFAAIRYGIRGNAVTIPEVVSCDMIEGLSDGLSVMLRVRADHGNDRGQKYHFYTVKVSETTL